ncbi:MAG: dUTP diphosphatase [Candidatus Cloacimonetes bacterium]|nr:dUTP diphosphatase [Candidatus Cloacimonadota bacterium]
MRTVKCKLLHTDAKLPTKVYESDSCFDLYSVEKKVVFPRCYEEVNLGIAVELPFGYGMFLRARSSQGKNGIQIHQGTVDQEFRGQLSVYVYNHSNRNYKISVGDRIAQAFIEPIQQVEFEEVKTLSESSRGKKGWGSSGK